MSICVIGGGISGLSFSSLLKEKKGISAEIFEHSHKAGGLIECDEVDGVLYHKVGGHVFNSKNEEVLNWFWSKFDKQAEFLKVERNAKILLQDRLVGYPLENHLYQLDKEITSQAVSDLLKSNEEKGSESNFKEFLLNTFGRTLCELYFFPYNEKIWQCELEKVSLDWLDGKLPNPKLKDILIDNIFKHKERGMVHSTFYYPVKGGSQFIADRLAENLNVSFNVSVDRIDIQSNGLVINNKHYDKLIYTGDIRRLKLIVKGLNKEDLEAIENVSSLLSHGTSNILCECDSTDLSWLYIPESFTRAHRIIYTGNFSKFNNGTSSRSTCTVEFSGKLSEEEMVKELTLLPGNLKPLSSNHQVNSYVIHEAATRDAVNNVKLRLAAQNIYLLGRFAEWEYFNMDTAIASAMALVDREF